MTNAFRKRIRASLNNPTLQAALDANAERRIKSSQEALSGLPDGWETLRQRAHAVRADVIEHLDQYLDEFLSQVQANGISVHQAASGEEALKIIIEITRATNARLAAKSKSMVSEEIDLNHALEASGMKVVETDLGEYIVQLRGERPAHLITPAVHLRRQEVGETFQQRLGLPYSDDIPTLVAAARQQLRHVFLQADVGISGVNFGVAESGTLCILTNEGNGRMVTTLPRVHIALMGMERLVPRLDDLALMLALLPRSATGQKLTVYTSLIHAPNEHYDQAEGLIGKPQQRHLVLLDNGRSAIRNSLLREALYCIRCGACLNACPVFRELGGHAYVGRHGEVSPYSGPIGSVISPALFGYAEFGHLARASSLCGACKDACPVDIDLPALLLRVRSGEVSSQSIHEGQPNPPKALAWGLRVFTWFASEPKRYHSAQRFLGVASRLAAPASNWIRLPALSGWGYSKDFPRPALRPFRDRFTTRKPGVEVVTQIPQSGRTVEDTRFPEGKSPDVLWQRFAQELNALGGYFYPCAESELPEAVFAFLRQRGIYNLMSAEPAHLPTSLVEKLRAAGINLIQSDDPSIRVSLTWAIAAAAETGSLLFIESREQPLVTSLLPEIHIACLRQGDIYASLREVLALPQVRQASAAVLISGPSRTADIEMSLTIGVHGPKELHVFCW